MHPLTFLVSRSMLSHVSTRLKHPLSSIAILLASNAGKSFKVLLRKNICTTEKVLSKHLCCIISLAIIW